MSASDVRTLFNNLYEQRQREEHRPREGAPPAPMGSWRPENNFPPLCDSQGQQQPRHAHTTEPAEQPPPRPQDGTFRVSPKLRSYGNMPPARETPSPAAGEPSKADGAAPPPGEAACADVAAGMAADGKKPGDRPTVEEYEKAVLDAVKKGKGKAKAGAKCKAKAGAKGKAMKASKEPPKAVKAANAT